MKIPSFPKRILGFLIRGSLFSCLFFTGAAQPIHSGLNAAHSSETFSIEANGLSSLGTVTLQSGADIRFGSDTPSYTVGEGHDILLGRSLGQNEAKLRVALKSPASLDASELAGSWQLYEYKVGQNSNLDHLTTSQSLAIQADTFIIDEERHATGTVNSAFTTFAVNTSKDLMVSTSSEFGFHTLRILVRLESGGTTSQMAGTWTVGSFGGDFSENPPDLWYDGDTLSASSTGVLTLSEGSASWATDGSGGITFFDPVDPEDPEEPVGTTKLSVTQSRNALAYANSPDLTREGAIVLRHAASPSIAALAGDWTLLTFELLADAANDPNVTLAYHSDGTTLASRQRFKDGQIHGQPANETWDQAGLPTLIEHYNAGVRTYSLEKRYIDSLPSEITETTNDGETETREYTRYYPGTTKLAERQRYKNDELDGQPAWETWNEAGQYTSIEFYNAGALTYRSETGYNGALLSSYRVTSYNGETITRENLTRYHPDSTTISLHSVETLTDEGRYALSESFYADGTQKERLERLDGEKNGLQQTWNEAGYKTKEQFYLDGQLDGIQRTFDSLGLPVTETTYLLGQLNGPYRKWHVGGVQISLEETYLNGQKDGLSETFTESGKPINSTLYALGYIREKTSWNYLPNGLLYSKDSTDYQTGVVLRVREWSHWNENGILVVSSRTLNGELDGLQSYYPSGLLTSEITYRRGVRHGPYRLWHFESELLKEEGLYLDGEYDGSWSSWHLNGELEIEGEYDNGVRTGGWAYYNDAGLQTRAETWDEGELRYKEHWIYQKDESELLLVLVFHDISVSDTSDLSDSSTIPDIRIVEEFDIDGSPSSYAEYERGQKEGIHRQYDGSGVLTSEIFYTQDLLHGSSRIFSSANEGALVTKDNYQYGKLHGESVRYDPPTGILLERSHYRKGRLHGLHELFYADGSPSLMAEYADGLRHGTHKRWNMLGELLEAFTFGEDLLHGPWKSYVASNRTGDVEGEYTNGLKSGTWTTYWITAGQDRIVRERSEYSNGFLDGLTEQFAFSGDNHFISDVTFRAEYSGGLLDGIWESRHFSGRQFTTSEYELGVEVGPRTVTQMSGEYTTYPLVDGRIDGLVASFIDPFFGLYGLYLGSEIHYTKGYKNGLSTTYYPNESIWSTGQYTNGFRSGYWETWLGFPTQYLLGESGPYGGSGQRCETWTSFGGTDYGPCAPPPPPPTLPIVRALRGQITANGTGIPNARIEVRGETTTIILVLNSKADGNYFIEKLPGVDTLFTLRITHDDHPTTEEFFVTIPEEDGVVIRNFSLDSYDNPTLSLQEPSVAGIHFLKDISLPLTIKGTVDWGDAPSGTLKLTHGEYSEEINASSPFSLSFNPGTDSEESGSGGFLEAILSGGETSNPVPLPDFKVVPQPDWTSSIGSWRAESPNIPGGPGTYYLKNVWPKTPLNIGISKVIIGEDLWNLWEEVPVVGGMKLGLFDLQFTVDAEIPTNENGEVVFVGQAEWILPIKSFRFDAKATATGKLQWTNNSLNLSEASVFLKRTGTVAIKAKAVKLLPALKTAYKIPLAGEFIQSLVDDLSVTINSKLNVAGVFPIDTINGDILFAPANVEFGFSMHTDFSLSTFKLSHKGSLVGTWNLEGESAVMKKLTLQNWVTAELSYKGWETFKETTGYSFTFPDRTSAKAKNRPIDFIPKLIEPDFLHLGNYAQMQSARVETVFSSQRSKQASSSQLLINNIYPDASPVLVEHNGTGALAYIHYDPARPEGQSTRLYVAFDTGSGFEPAALVHSEARADFNPQLSFLSDGRLIAVWETSILDQIATSLDERITGLEIAWAIYDPGSKTWSNPVLLSDNTYLDHNPILANSSQGPMLVWRSNVSSELLATAGFPDQVNFTTWNGTVFSAPAPLPYDLFPLGSISLAYDGTEAVFTWIHDEDTDIGTAEDRELYWADYDGSNWTAPIRATNDQVKDHNPRVFCLENGDFELVWAKDETLVRMSSFGTRSHQALFDLATSHYEIVCDSFGRIALLWTDYNDSQMDLRYALIDTNSGTQSDELYLTNDTGYETAPSFTLNDEGEIAAVYLSQKVDSEQHDLYILNHSLGIDLAVSSPTFSPSLNRPGEFEITAELMNLGDLTASNAAVEFYLGDPDNGGAFLKSSTITLHGGNKSYYTFTSSGIQPEDNGLIYVRIDPSDTVTETDESNNTASSLLTLRELDDDDGDGIPDAWEQKHFEDLDEDGSGDMDHDGFSDLYEYLTLTDPGDASSNFKYSIVPDPSIEGNYLIRFPTVAGRTYRIQRTTNLINWFDHSFNEGDGNQMEVSVPGINAPESQYTFYRIRIQQD